MRITVLAGGVGGAKLVDGFARILSPEQLKIIVNTGDDFVHFGLNISPDIDTVCYTLAGLSNTETGWGRDSDTSHVLTELQKINAPDWFHLGDKDLATHMERTRLLSQGLTLTTITKQFCELWNVKFDVFPMCDQKVSTIILTSDGIDLSFQDYFVKFHCEPVIKNIYFHDSKLAKLSQGVIDAIAFSDFVVISPSNPWVSIDPILNIPGMRHLLQDKHCIGISPIISGKALKGPADKMFTELGITPSALSVAQHYQGLIEAFFLDNSDALLTRKIEKLGINPVVTNIFMPSPSDRVRLARTVLDYLETRGF